MFPFVSIKIGEPLLSIVISAKVPFISSFQIDSLVHFETESVGPINHSELSAPAANALAAPGDRVGPIDGTSPFESIT